VRESVGDAEDEEALQQIAETISNEILKPLGHTLRNKEAAVFAPSHTMQLFPCAALLLNGTPLFLHKIVYVIPSLSVFSHLIDRRTRRAAPTATRSTAAILASSTAAGARMSATELVNDESGEAIPMIGPEAAMIADALDTSPVDLAACSNDELRSILGSSDIVHLATHGTAVFESPWQSYLDTQPPYFRVLDLAALTDCAARLVVFSCCWSGAGSANPGNDIIGFAHATLASGTQAYIGGLWRTEEMASMLLMVLFYREIASRRQQKQNVRLAEVWRSAQIALYHADKEFVRTLLVEAKNIWSNMLQHEETKHTLEQFKHSEKCLDAYLREYSKKFTDAPVRFKHPVMWAPYALVGNGDVVLD
jgi:CHAT domain-containing protein